ncbi:YHS domain-containing protein [Nitrospina gracilis]|nr:MULTISPECIES: YHS domain-containing protein [Nitrospina]MCF8722878.1 YHS domain-containing protein [Nitrospina sp. Nb-3]
MARFALIALGILILFFLFRWAFASPSKKADNPDATDMVKDPNCRMYVPKPEAIRKTIQGNELFFCSEKCAEEYRNKQASAR